MRCRARQHHCQYQCQWWAPLSLARCSSCCSCLSPFSVWNQSSEGELARLVSCLPMVQRPERHIRTAFHAQAPVLQSLLSQSHATNSNSNIAGWYIAQRLCVSGRPLRPVGCFSSLESQRLLVEAGVAGSDLARHQSADGLFAEPRRNNFILAA